MIKSDIGVIGLGVMGKNIALNMLNHGFLVSGYNRSFEKVQELIDMNINSFSGFRDIKDFILSLKSPRRVFLMVNSGSPVDSVIEELIPLLDRGDIIMDGGNSFFEDTNRRCHYLNEKGINYFGVGVSGGEEGALKGPSIMPSGNKEVYKEIANILESISAKKDNDNCCKYIGPYGSGHYVKMVHNGIEYADMQLLSEVYLILKYVAGYSNFEISNIFSEWNNAEVQSYLVSISSIVLKEKDSSTDNDLVDMIKDVSGNKGTGKWTSIEALKQEYNASLLTAAYQARVMSNKEDLREKFNKELEVSNIKIDLDVLLKAYSLAKSIAFSQGFGLYKDASNKYGWNLNLKEIASIFRAGCIIQAKLLQEIMDAYDEDISDLLLSESFKNRVLNNIDSLKEVVILGLQHNLALPVFTSALTYINQITSNNLGANIIQAQRDYFGAHTYQRKDKDGLEHHKWY